MSYRITTHEAFVATITITDAHAVEEIELDDETRASVDDAGSLVSLEVDDPARRFGEPFDQAAAERAVEWARARLTGSQR